MTKTEVSNKRPIIDSHQHVFWHNRDDHGLIEDMDACEIERAWLLTWEIHPEEDAPGYHRVLNPARFRADGTHPGITLDDLLIARDRYPERFILGHCPHPLHPNATHRLRSSHHMFGAKVCGEWKFRIPFDDPRCIELFRVAGELGMPVVLHLDVAWQLNSEGILTYRSSWYGGNIETLERALIACPDTSFVGHAPGFWQEICGAADERISGQPAGAVKPGGRLIKMLDQYPNLYADLSANSGLTALNRDLQHAKTFLQTYADRLLFGRDFYGDKLMKLLNSLHLPNEVLDKILYKNASRMLA